MKILRRPPAPVIAATAIGALLGLLFAVVGIAALFSEGADELTVVTLLLAVGLLTAGWGVWRGSSAARVTAVALGVLLFISGLTQLVSAPGAGLVSVLAGAALVGLLCVPASARAYFAGNREPAPLG
jgi:hypothetical protein